MNHELLVSKLSAYHVTDKSLALFRSYLADRSQYVFVNGKRSSLGKIEHGVPQGSILGPLLFTLYINDMPLHISQPSVRCSMFADDATLDCSTNDVNILSKSLQTSLDDISQWCHENYMVPSATKTECMLIATRQWHQLHQPSLSLTLNSQPLRQVSEHRLLGVVIDDQLEWHAHLDKVCKTVSRNLFLLSKLIHFTDVPTRQLFYHAHVQPHIDYASTVWDGCSDACIKRLNSLHRRAAKLILPKRSDSTDERMKELGMLPLRKQLLFNKGVLMHKIQQSSAPQYLTDLFSPAASPYSSSRNSLLVPRPRLDIFKNSLSFSGAKLWNALPKEVTGSPTTPTFRGRLKKHLEGLDT